MMNKTIPVFDEAGNYIKDVFPGYAIQRVLKGQAIWIKRSSAIQVLKPCPIPVSYTHLTLPTNSRV